MPKSKQDAFFNERNFKVSQQTTAIDDVDGAIRYDFSCCTANMGGSYSFGMIGQASHRVKLM